MKRIATLLLFLCACRGENPPTTTDTVSTSHPQTTGTTSPTSTGSKGGAANSLSAGDKDFFVQAAQANLAEVSVGRMAADKAENAGVKAYASKMIADHGQANEELKQLALQKGVALPSVVRMAQMIRDHEKVVRDFQSANIADPDLRAWASKTLPTLQGHLDMAKQIESQLK